MSPGPCTHTADHELETAPQKLHRCADAGMPLSGIQRTRARAHTPNTLTTSNLSSTVLAQTTS
eukprot:6184308-Pleurochrysis_carterae.AAC.4